MCTYKLVYELRALKDLSLSHQWQELVQRPPTRSPWPTNRYSGKAKEKPRQKRVQPVIWVS